MGFGFNSLIRKRNSVDMEPAAVNKNRDKFLFLQVCEVQYSNPSDIFRRAPLQKATAQEPTVCPGMEIWLLEYGRNVPAGFSVQSVKANPRETFVCGWQCPGQESIRANGCEWLNFILFHNYLYYSILEFK